MARNKILLSLFAWLLIVLIACHPTGEGKKDAPIRVAFSKSSGNENYLLYEKWLKAALPQAECINMYGLNHDSAAILLKSCHGLILTGGPDVHPGRYNRLHDTLLCDVDLYRDTLEYKLIEAATKHRIPILGICRGMQILNTAFGGSLIPDIPEYHGKKIMHRAENSDSCFHDIYFIKNSDRFAFKKNSQYNVNSIHHQAVDKVASTFSVVAIAADSIPEIMENSDAAHWIFAVQFHPERMKNDHPLSTGIRREFIRQTTIFYSKKHTNH